MTLSDEVKLGIHKALEETKGDTKLAAKLLDSNESRLKAIIRNNPEFHARWGKHGKGTLNEAETVNRKPVTKENPEEKFALELRKQDKLLKTGLSAVGITGKAADEAVAYSVFARQSFDSVRNMVDGGAAKLFADLMSDVRDVRQEIAHGIDDLEREKTLREDRSRLVKHLLELNDRVQKAAFTQAQILAKKDEIKSGRKSGKPGFTPVQAIQIKTDAKTVTINEGTTEKNSGVKPDVQD
jgi:hypothetical protein